MQKFLLLSFIVLSVQIRAANKDQELSGRRQSSEIPSAQAVDLELEEIVPPSAPAVGPNNISVSQPVHAGIDASGLPYAPEGLGLPVAHSIAVPVQQQALQSRSPEELARIRKRIIGEAWTYRYAGDRFSSVCCRPWNDFHAAQIWIAEYLHNSCKDVVVSGKSADTVLHDIFGTTDPSFRKHGICGVLLVPQHLRIKSMPYETLKRAFEQMIDARAANATFTSDGIQIIDDNGARELSYIDLYEKAARE